VIIIKPLSGVAFGQFAQKVVEFRVSSLSV